MLDDLLAPIEVIVDRDISLGVQQYHITALVSTKLWTFKEFYVVEFKVDQLTYVDLEYFQAHLYCMNCFSLEHTVCNYDVQSCLIAPIPQRPRGKGQGYSEYKGNTRTGGAQRK